MTEVNVDKLIEIGGPTAAALLVFVMAIRWLVSAFLLQAKELRESHERVFKDEREARREEVTRILDEHGKDRAAFNGAIQVVHQQNGARSKLVE